MYIRGRNSGSWSSWLRVIDSNTIGSQSVNYAASAGTAGSCSGNAATSSSCTGNAATATNATNATNATYGRYVYNNGAYSGSGWVEASDLGVRYANTAGSAPANGGTSAACSGVSQQVQINYGNDSNSTYYMLWGSGNSVYGTNGIYCNPYTDTIYATGDVVAYASDGRLKKNVVAIPDALGKVMALTGVYYNWNELAGSFGYTDKKQHIGVIAQDVQAVAPELVTNAPFDFEVSEGGEGGSKSGENYLTVDYAKMSALFIEAFKAQQAQINELRAEIEILKAK
jgi:hypothetical protein